MRERSDTARTEDLIYSDLATEPDMLMLIEMFVAELPDRIAAMAECEGCGDWDELGRLAHQIKGACGCYGFHQLTDYAASVESACRRTSPQSTEIADAMGSLSDALSRTRPVAKQD